MNIAKVIHLLVDFMGIQKIYFTYCVDMVYFSQAIAELLDSFMRPFLLFKNLLCPANWLSYLLH
jgi:hypothetical protein